ncbi:hypothetical protein H6P81_011034 [Aristolochia fimbriata]|uniref:Uncharacterized protein n=1 Tax=Aristolochia fimbriata TaxID=158543 RepID=A0AAV7ER43_ARIFI|nr:hypothetical protein H6P81_011034 [Aristolochia fimbriata]
MEGVSKSQSKLTRTQSSILRSPTVRSSIHSLSAIDEESQTASEKPKPHRPLAAVSAHRALRILAAAAFLAFFIFYVTEEIPVFPNLLVPAILVAVAYLAKRGFGVRGFWEDHRGRRRSGLSKGVSVEWTIGGGGDSLAVKKDRRKIVREGIEFYSNGDIYEGEFHKGKCNGSGVYNYFLNGRYEGDWIDGRYDGYGIESWARGSRYRGQYRQGMRHGYGAYRFYTGDSYAGEWFNGQSHGVGIQTCSDGSSYVGEFKCGVKHGVGCYHFRNGDRYAGEYFADKIHGFGVYHFANSHCYEGSWHEGRKQGFGMYTFRNADTQSGEWDSGVLKNSLPPSSDSVLRAVQAARRIAEKALRVPRVEEQVSKAIMAANRAATAARVAAVKAVQNRMDGKFCDLDV